MADSEIRQMGFTWYIVEEDGTTQKLAATTSDVTSGADGVYTCNAANMTVDPNGWTGLEANKTYNVLCVVNGKTSDGTSKWQTPMRGYKLTVTPADLSQGAVVFTQTAEEFAGTMGNIGDGKGTFVFTPWGGNADSPSELSYLFKVTYNGQPLKLDEDYTIKGSSNLARNAGTHTLTIEGMGNYTGKKSVTWTLEPYELSVENFRHAPINKTYDGTDAVTDSTNGISGLGGFIPDSENPRNPPTGDNLNLHTSDYQLSNMKFDSAEAGDRTFTGTMTLKPDGNFVFADGSRVMQIEYGSSGLVSVSINRATIAAPAAKALQVANNHAATYTVDLSALLPALEAPREYGAVTYGAPTVNLSSDYYTEGARVEDGKLISPIQAVKTDKTGSIGSVQVKVSTTNYHDFTLTVNLRSVNKRKLGMFVSVATDPVVYGMTLGDIKLSAEATDGDQVIPGTIAWEDPLPPVPAAGRATYRWTFTPDDTMHYLTASNTITFLVDKATPTGAPTYTAITAGGKTLADAALTANASWPSGTVQWVDKDGKVLDTATTDVKANTAYQWKFTPDSKNYDPIEGSITLYYVSTGGGGSTTYPVSTPSKTENGSVSVSPKNASRGDTVTITVKPDDGYVLDDLAVTDKNGNDLKLTDKGNGKYTFTMPAGKVEVKASFAEEAETSPFADVVTDAYYYEAVKWAAEQGITGGIGNNLFGPNQPCTRAQIVTFLWRAVGCPEPKGTSSFSDVPSDAYYAKAVAWAVENGITDGVGDNRFAPDVVCTRGQMVTLLYRFFVK